MANAGRKATAALVAAAAIMMVGRVSAQGEPIAATAEREATIVLHVTNYAELSREVLAGAMARVAMIYERIGVRIAWVDDLGSVRRHADGQLHLTVQIATPAAASCAHTRTCTPFTFRVLTRRRNGSSALHCWTHQPAIRAPCDEPRGCRWRLAL